jgi:tRNA-modifying protein YgfZ
MPTADLTSGRLPHLGVLRFAGADAATFLQGQVSNDTKRLAESKPLFAAYSSPQGRVLALLHLLPHSNGLLAILPRELAQPTLQALKKFVMRAKVTIEDASAHLCVAGTLDTGSVAERSGYAEQDGVAIAAVDGSRRRWLVGSPEILQNQGWIGEPSGSEVFGHAWRLADIRAGLPQIYLATRETFVAQMLNLDLLDGISFSKGCYTGQEIIARTQHLGRIKRRLYRLQLPDLPWTIGQSIRLADGRTGRLIEVESSGAGFEALAVLNVDVEADSSHSSPVDAVAAVQLPLPYSFT